MFCHLSLFKSTKVKNIYGIVTDYALCFSITRLNNVVSKCDVFTKKDKNS